MLTQLSPLSLFKFVYPLNENNQAGVNERFIWYESLSICPQFIAQQMSMRTIILFLIGTQQGCATISPDNPQLIWMVTLIKLLWKGRLKIVMKYYFSSEIIHTLTSGRSPLYLPGRSWTDPAAGFGLALSWLLSPFD